MEIIEVDAQKFKQVMPTAYNVFCTADFNELNRTKCQSVYYLLFRNNKYRLGLIGGIKDGVFYSPFSAPYGGFSFCNDNIRIQYIEEALIALDAWAGNRKVKSIQLTLPPEFYHRSFVSKQINCLYRHCYKTTRKDLDFFFHLENLNESYLNSLKSNARSNLRISLTSGLKFEKSSSPEGYRLVYDIIKRNKEARGFPLHMQWHQIEDVARIIEADFFLVRDADGIPIASAIVFHPADKIAQIIYWGDLREYGVYKPMNFLSFKIFEFYKERGYKIVDLGPSTENSVPNYGLCEFKESIGCEIVSKLAFIKEVPVLSPTVSNELVAIGSKA